MRFLKSLVRGNKSYKSGEQAKEVLEHCVSTNLSNNLMTIKHLFTEMPDLVIRNFTISQTSEQAALVYIDGLIDKVSINEHILHPLLHEYRSNQTSSHPLVAIGSTRSTCSWLEIEDALFLGYSALFINGRSECILCDSQGWPQRALEEPQTESTLKGAHQGFIETAKQNIALIRRYIPNRELKIKELKVGKRGKTQISILYLADVVNPEVLREMINRINDIRVDAIINTGEIEELIEDNSFSIFPQLLVTERPDAVASHILQGRIALVVDASPGVLIGPMTFTSFFQTVDDYSTRWIVASTLRLLRFLGLFIAIFLPSLYIAVITFHYEVIPLQLLLTLGQSRAIVPFPPIIEALMMEIFLEMLREAGLRLPAPVGQAVGIVGGIVIGQAAVQAGLVSNIMVIVVSMTAIASFIIPNYDMSTSIRLLRFPMMVLAALFGMVGIVVGTMTVVGHLLSLESLKTPYGTPIGPVNFADHKDTFIRFPMWKLDRRPYSAKPKQLTRFNWDKDSGE
ncbi:MAG: spore germination protein [Firmicutes bacterium]|nr:spore germination protein [Bacillota bacterium]